MLQQKRKILHPLPEEWHPDGNHVQSIKEILTKRSLRSSLIEHSVRGRDDAHVHLNRLRSAHPFEFALLKHPEQLGLNLQGHITHLIEKQRARIRQLEASGLVLDRAGEGPPHVSEQFAFQQIGGQRRAIDGDHFFGRARAVEVDGVCHQLLSRPALSLN